MAHMANDQISTIEMLPQIPCVLHLIEHAGTIFFPQLASIAYDSSHIFVHSTNYGYIIALISDVCRRAAVLVNVAVQ